MSGKKFLLSPLELRKQFLIAESELNRDQLDQDMAEFTEGVRALAGRAKTFGSIASSTAVVLAGLTAFRRHKSSDGDVKPSWLQTILKGSSLVSTLWLALRSKRCDRKDR
jgi:hypothetical protein